MGAFARISAEILELAEGAAKDLRLLPVGGTGTRGGASINIASTSDRTILSRDSHRRVPLLDVRFQIWIRTLSAGEGGLMVYPEGSGPPSSL